ncbi:MAG TPA: hypothetical protein VGH00_01305 [Chthoniobacterales bacterium]|jgi:hypothetical protein
MTIPSDTGSIDAIIKASYNTISGPAGRKRDWARQRALFLPGARLIPTAVKPGENESGLAPQFLDVETYITRVEPLFREKGFYETEIARRTEEFGRIAQVWSTYESRYRPDDPEPFMRGINSFQLFHDETRWWIVNIYWQHENAAHPLPEKYL